MPKAKEKRLVRVRLCRKVPQYLTQDVEVPADWTDEQVKAKLSEIYEEVDCSSHDWQDEVDYDPEEGTHELEGEPPPAGRPDLVFPAEDEDADDQ